MVEGIDGSRVAIKMIMVYRVEMELLEYFNMDEGFFFHICGEANLAI
jgi:hypothetical protein